MAGKGKTLTRNEALAGYAVLAVLAAFAVWLMLAQARFNPAVIVAMNHPKGAARLVAGQQTADSITARILAGGETGSQADQGTSREEALAGNAPLGPVEAYSAQTLSDKIDGKAELYLASAFQEMACRPFAAGEARVEVFLYAMESPKDAFAVLSAQRRPGAQSLAFTPNAYATSNALFFTRERFYVELVADRASPELQPALESMAQALMAALPAGTAQADTEQSLFPSTGLRAGSVRLAVSDALGMEGLANVYTAEYALAAGEAGAFLALRATPEEAARQAKAYIAFLENAGFKRTTPPGAPAGAVVMAFDTMVQVVMTQGRAFTGVHDAANPEAALELAREVATALEGKDL